MSLLIKMNQGTNRKQKIIFKKLINLIQFQSSKFIYFLSYYSRPHHKKNIINKKA